MKEIRCTINNRLRTLQVDERESLAEVLRRHGLTSVKESCLVGECGACAVLIDGKAQDSCLYLAVWAEGKDIVTVEGLRSGDNELHPIQKAFIAEAAVQCGFCTPGMIMTSVEILSEAMARKKAFSREELRTLISGHLCRCTGYENILNALETAQKEAGL